MWAVRAVLAVLVVLAVLAVLAVCAVLAVWAVLAVRVLWDAACDCFAFGLCSGYFVRFELFGLLGAIAADIWSLRSASGLLCRIHSLQSAIGLLCRAHSL